MVLGMVLSTGTVLDDCVSLLYEILCKPFTGQAGQLASESSENAGPARCVTRSRLAPSITSKL